MTCFGLLFVLWCTPASASSVAAVPYCETYRPMKWSSKDTRLTKEDIDTENAKWTALCGEASQ